MALICIDRPTAERMKQAVKAGEINIQKMYEMTSVERRGVFEKFASPELAQHINGAFEKAMVSSQQDALTSWAKAVFTPADKSGANFKGVMDKIKELDQAGVLNPKNQDEYLSDLVAEKLGAAVSADEVKEISKRALKLEELYKKTDEFGLPDVGYWVERKRMDDYLNGLVPNNTLKVLTSTAGRGAMLFSPKSIGVNVVSNTVQGLFTALERRVSSGKWHGNNDDYALRYARKAMEIYSKSGYDVTRITALDGQRRLGEEVTHAQGPGIGRAIGRFYEDTIFKWGLGAPDVAASAIAFADTANLAAAKIAKAEGLKGAAAKARSLEILKEATQLKSDNQHTMQSLFVRNVSVAEAQRATFTNKGQMAKFALGLRNVINNATGDFRMGDQLMPFVKTPANVIGATLEASAVSVPFTLPYNLFFKVPEAMRQARVGNKAPLDDLIRQYTRAGLGVSLAFILAYSINPEDYIPDFDALTSKGKDMARIKNAPYNSVKVKGRYISLDYFGPLAAPLVGFLYARKFGETPGEKIFQYGRGSLSQMLKVPGMKEFSGLVHDLSGAVQKGDPVKVGVGLADEAVAFVRARVIPAVVNDVAKATDPYVRQTGKSQLSKAQASIPGLRQKLPPKIDQLTGDPVESEGFWSEMLFGSRVKKANENAAVKEFSRLSDIGAGPAVSDIQFASPRFKELEKQLGPEKFQKAVQFYGAQLGKLVERRIASAQYQKFDDETRREALNAERRKAMEKTLKTFKYRKPKK